MNYKRLFDWLDASTCNFLAAKTIAAELDRAGFLRLDPAARWDIHPGDKYYIMKNDSAVFAFIPGTSPVAEVGLRIIAAHSDSPCFKIKPNPERYGDGGVVSLNVEKYGGGILYTWFDRPLSVSGRVILRTENPLAPETRIIDLRRPVATIPHLAIHFNRAVNEGNKLSVQKDMLPVMGYYDEKAIAEFKRSGGPLKHLLASHLEVNVDDILDYELSLYPLEKTSTVGVNDEYFQSGRIDDLSMAFAALEALLDTADIPCEAMRLMAIFDNEETGSGTKQGAASPVVRHLVERLNILTGGTAEDYYRAVAKSFLISADDAHAWHPNYNDKYDPTNHPVIGGGPVVKINANCKYMTDAAGAAVFRRLCEEADVKCQYFVNHSDVAGGSTLGNILTSQLDIAGVDMGAAIWAMHSARETAGLSDHFDIVKVFSRFFS